MTRVRDEAATLLLAVQLLTRWPLPRFAAAMLTDMASFENAGVSGPAQ